ncbi:MAG: SUMF1/EgtB/PvdO family nonheme iron enzyme [Bacteroidales bacterium]|nr:SUMF1/EgtB/PvdO family nonheme iron enzyme [Bacteroidales bacterium]
MVLQYVNSQPELGFLAVSSEPTDADIYIDGKNYGKTNNVITDLAVGTHELQLEKAGYVTLTKTFVTTKGETLKLNETLQAVSNKADKKQQVSSVTKETFTVKGVSFTMIAVEGGTFKMGATSEQGSDDEKPVHNVTLSDYYIGETEVTQELWQAVMGTNPSYSKGNKKPVEKVSWDDCQEFIRKLNQLTGMNFRLPTEAEWEYAARGGNKSKGYKYSGSNTIDNVAWYTSNSGSKTHDVKTKQSNELGIYDMSGNVWEWCQDRYGSYSSSSQTNPTGSSSGSYRVLRGGCWGGSAGSCRVSYRYYFSPDDRYYNLGLRLAL